MCRRFLKRRDRVGNPPAAALSFREISVGRTDRFQHRAGDGRSAALKEYAPRSSQCVDHQCAAVVAGNSDGEQALRLRHRYAHTLRHCGGRLFVQLPQGHPLDISRGAFDLFYLAFVGVFVWVAFTAPLSVGQQLLIGRFHQSDRVCAAEVRFPAVSGSDCPRCIDNDTALPFHPPNSSSSPRSDSHGTFRGRFWTPERGGGEVIYDLPYGYLLALKINGGVCAEIVAFFNVCPVKKHFSSSYRANFSGRKPGQMRPKSSDETVSDTRLYSSSRFIRYSLSIV